MTNQLQSIEKPLRIPTKSEKRHILPITNCTELATDQDQDILGSIEREPLYNCSSLLLHD